MGSDSAIQSVVTSLRVLQAFTATDRVLGVSELSRRLGIGKSTVHRALQTLAGEGFVEQTSGGRYRLGMKLWELGHQVVSGLELLEVARPHLEQLQARTGELTELAVLDGADAAVVDRVEGNDPPRGSSRGTRLPAHCSAAGKAMLAFVDGPAMSAAVFAAGSAVGLRRVTARSITSIDLLGRVLAQVRRDGVAIAAEEGELGVHAVGAPVFDHRSAVVAGLSVSGPVGRFSRERMREVAPWVRRAAQQISHELGHRGSPLRTAAPAATSGATGATGHGADGAAAALSP